MADSRLYLFDLVEDNLTHLSSFLDAGDLIQLSRTSKHSFALFKTANAYRLLKNGFDYIWNGDPEKARALFQANPGLLFTETAFSYFPNISPFKLALWALNCPMWQMMLECLPINERGLAIAEKLLLQYKEVRDKGIAYQANEGTITSSHYDYSLITTAADNLAKAYYRNEQEMESTLRAFSNAQLNAPAPTIYCQDEEYIYSSCFSTKTSRFDRQKLIENGLGEYQCIIKGTWQNLRLVSLAAFVHQAENRSPGLPDDINKDMSSLKTMVDKAKSEFIVLERLLVDYATKNVACHTYMNKPTA